MMENHIEALIAFNSPLLPDMTQLKYQAMSENLFRYFRGTAHLFFADWQKHSSCAPAPAAWICGDLHLENFGTFKAENRQVYFDLNDFDEALLAPATWEIVRTVASIFVAFETLEIDRRKAVRLSELFLRTYSNSLASGKIQYIDPRTATGIVSTFLNAVEKRKTRDLINKKTMRAGKHPVFRLPHEKHRELDRILKQELHAQVDQWIRHNNESPYNFHVLDSVFRVAGTGSMGLRRYALLLKNKNKREKYLLLDMKQVRSSSVTPFCDTPQPVFETDGERVVAIQRMMQNVSPALLSCIPFRDELFLVQEMQPTEDNIRFDLVRNRYRDMYKVIDDMAMLTASAQLRSAGRRGAAGPDELINFGNDCSWHPALLEYALDYAERVKVEYKSFLKWRKQVS